VPSPTFWIAPCRLISAEAGAGDERIIRQQDDEMRSYTFKPIGNHKARQPVVAAGNIPD
jgi:hypothetical protein